MANDVSKEECCKGMGIGYGEAISNEAIFMLHAGMKRENCKACKGLIYATYIYIHFFFLHH
jgi:RNase P subunit RPR2